MDKNQTALTIDLDNIMSAGQTGVQIASILYGYVSEFIFSEEADKIGAAGFVDVDHKLKLTTKWAELPPHVRRSVIIHEATHVFQKIWKRRAHMKELLGKEFNESKFVTAIELEAESIAQDIWNILGLDKLNGNQPYAVCYKWQDYGVEPGLCAEQYYFKLPDNKCANTGSLAGHLQGDEESEANSQEADKSGRSAIESMAEAIIKGIGSQAGSSKALFGIARVSLPLADVIASLAEDTSGEEPSYEEFNFFQIAMGQGHMPGLAKRLGDEAIVVVVDTSGSMWVKEGAHSMIERALGVIFHIAKKFDSPVVVYQFDTTIHGKPIVITSADELKKMTVEGGGGTDMAEAIHWACSNHKGLRALIVVTDCLTGWPNKPPEKVKVYVADVTGSGSAPNWATLVKVS